MMMMMMMMMMMKTQNTVHWSQQQVIASNATK